MLTMSIPSSIAKANLHFGNDNSGSATRSDTKPAKARASMLVKEKKAKGI
jgi:hypothetical protein